MYLYEHQPSIGLTARQPAGAPASEQAIPFSRNRLNSRGHFAIDDIQWAAATCVGFLLCPIAIFVSTSLNT
jgi:hypothetical protein